MNVVHSLMERGSIQRQTSTSIQMVERAHDETFTMLFIIFITDKMILLL
jgi:hypothetical protein